MSDSEIVAAAVAQWQQGHPITDGQARVIASQWHGGQTSALYSFASTGTIDAETDDTASRLVWEITREIDAVGALVAESEGLEALRAYVAQHGARGPVDGWAQVWG